MTQFADKKMQAFSLLGFTVDSIREKKNIDLRLRGSGSISEGRWFKLRKWRGFFLFVFFLSVVLQCIAPQAQVRSIFVFF